MRIERFFNSPSKERDLELLIHAERFVNRGSPSGFTLRDAIASRYHPNSTEPDFQMPVAIVPSSTLREFQAEPGPTIQDFVHSGPPGTAAICIHPEMLAEWCGPAPTSSVAAVPTASGRTVLVTTSDGAIFAKLHFARRIGRLHRHLSLKRVAGAIEVSRELDRLTTHRALDASVAFLPESVGLVATDPQDFGVIYRECTSSPATNDNSFLVPFFSLFAPDTTAPHDTSLLHQLCAAAQRPQEFFLQSIIRPLFRAWRSLALDGGMMPENHAQNILLEIARDGRPRRVVHRDLYEFLWDAGRRRDLQMSCAGEKKVDVATDAEYCAKMRSYFFDFKFCHYTLGPLIREFARSFGCSSRNVLLLVRQVFHDVWPDANEFFLLGPRMFAVRRDEVTFAENRPLFVERAAPLLRQ